MDPSEILQALSAHKWLALAILFTGHMTRMLESDSSFPVCIDKRWQPVSVIVLGQISAVLLAVTGGIEWKEAIVSGLAVSFLSMGLYDLTVKAILGDRPAPAWLNVLALVFEHKRPPNPPNIGTTMMVMSILLLALGCSAAQRRTETAVLNDSQLACAFASTVITSDVLAGVCGIDKVLVPVLDNLIAVREGARKSGVTWQPYKPADAGKD